MKRKLTLTVDEEVIRAGKELARQQGTSLSQLVEEKLREGVGAPGPSFARRWRGRFRMDERPGDVRLAYLKEHYK